MQQGKHHDYHVLQWRHLTHKVVNGTIQVAKRAECFRDPHASAGGDNTAEAFIQQQNTSGLYMCALSRLPRQMPLGRHTASWQTSADEQQLHRTSLEQRLH